MKWRSWVSRVLAGVAMTVVAALIVFVGVPWLQWPPAIEEIVAEAPAMLAEEGAENAEILEDAQEGDGTAAPLVAVRNNGDEVAVVFRTGATESPEEEATAAGDDPPQGVAEPDPLPPVLSAEEIAGALEALEAGPEEEADVPAVAGDTQMAEADEPADAVAAAEPLQPSDTGPLRGEMGQGDSLKEEAALPPPSATREVQELLEALGYAPGPVDGIWGARTAGAWRSFAADRASEAERVQPQPESAGTAESRNEGTAGPSDPSGGAVEGIGAEQAGVTHRRTGLPPIQAREPVVVPRTLRGVMGYRMPLVGRQGVPDQVVSGVLIPAHTTFVILKPGQWELVGLSEEEARLLTEASERPALGEPEGVETVKEGNAETRRFRLFDIFGTKNRRGAE